MALYARLDDAKNEIRLIRVQGHSGTLALELATYSIDDAVPWVALSYCWGDQAATETVTVNDNELRVRHNLYAFLRQMASEDRRDWIFIDAICINQSDMAERASQVARMGQIYRKAKEVIAWVYLEDSDESRAITKGNRQAEIEIALRDWQRLEQVKRTAGQELTYKERQSRTEVVKMVKALILFSNYWSRLWIVQEILLAKVLTIRWLSHTFDWLDIIFSDAVTPGRQLGDLLPRQRPLQPHPLSVSAYFPSKGGNLVLKLCRPHEWLVTSSGPPLPATLRTQSCASSFASGRKAPVLIYKMGHY